MRNLLPCNVDSRFQTFVLLLAQALLIGPSLQLPKHSCIQALKQQVKDLSDQLEQQRIDFQFRQTRLEEYVRRHEAGDRISWGSVVDYCNHATAYG